MAEDWMAKLSALRGAMTPEPEAESAPEPTPAADKAVQKERLDIIFEKKGRGGKQATIITGFTIADDDIAELASEMKRRLGAGGSARGGEILIQGDRRTDVLKFLTAKGFKARVI